MKKIAKNFLFLQALKNKSKIVFEFLKGQRVKINNAIVKLDGLRVDLPLRASIGDIIAIKSVGIVFEKKQNEIGFNVEIDKDRVSNIMIGNFREFVIKTGQLKEEAKSLEQFKKFYPEFIPKPKLIDEIKKKFPVPDPIKDKFYIPEDKWYFLIRQFLRRRQVLLIGASGTGKTEMMQFIVRKMKEQGEDINLEIFDMAVANAEASFKGMLHIENGKSEFRLSRFARVIQRPNTLILLDEFNRGDVSVQNIFMPILDNRKTLFIEKLQGEEQIKVAENTFFWATANLGVGFVGAGSIDEAVAQRFVLLQIDYMPPEIESEILQVRTGIDEINADMLTELANEIRKSEEFTIKPSTRNLLITAELIADGFDFKTAVMLGIYSQMAMIDLRANDDGLKKFLEKLIKDILNIK